LSRDYGPSWEATRPHHVVSLQMAYLVNAYDAFWLDWATDRCFLIRKVYRATPSAWDFPLSRTWIRGRGVGEEGDGGR
jgi:hypothetical protein